MDTQEQQWLADTRAFWNVDDEFTTRYRRILLDERIERTDDRRTLDRLWDERTGGELAMLLDGVPIEPGWRCLEIGCGIGRLMKPVAARCAGVIGVDVSEQMIAMAGDYLAGVANVELHVNDGRTLAAVEDGSIDCVYSVLAFQHMTLPEVVQGYLAEVARVLRPGGYCRIQTWREAPTPWSQRAKNLLRPLLGAPCYYGPRRWEWREGRRVQFGGMAFHPRDWRRLHRRAGLCVVRTQLGVGHDFWMWTTARKGAPRRRARGASDGMDA